MKKTIATTLVLTILLLSLSACDQAAPTFAPGTTAQQTTVPVTTEKPLKLDHVLRCKDITIENSDYTFIITPPGFDFEELNERGYRMTIEIVFEVRYEKTWDVLFDIGYLGAPKYEVYILNDDFVAEMDENVVAPARSEARTISYRTDIVNLMNSKIYLKFSSNNIQNKIHFENIKVYYDCFEP